MVSKVSVINVSEINPPNQVTEAETNRNITTNASYWNALYPPLILGICILSTSILTLIPRHNSLAYPEYWFEMAIILVLAFSISSTVSYVMEVFIYMNLKSIASVWIVARHFTITLLAYGIPYGLFCFSWTNILHYNHPMPFLAYFTGITSWLLTLPFVWFLIPLHLRKKREYKIKTIMYILYSVVWMLITIQRMALSILFKVLSDELQFLMAIFVPFCRSFDSWALSKLVFKMSGEENEAGRTFLNVSVTLSFAIFVAVMLASSNDFTVYCTLGVEFFLHLKSCFYIIRNKNRSQTDQLQTITKAIEEQREIEEMILSETVEALVPLAYAANFAIAYYGPNSKMIGNVRAEYWAFKEVENVQQLYNAMLLMFIFDVGCIVATGILLWLFAKTNIVQKFLNLMKKSWWMLLLKLSASSTSFLTMFAQNDINNGCDFTFEFGWIIEGGRQSLIQNATDLTNDEKLILLE